MSDTVCVNHCWVYGVFAVWMALVWSGCTHKGPAANTPSGIRDYQISQSILKDDEQKTFSVITVLEDGRYQWRVRDWWATPVRDHSFGGQLPDPLLRRLKAVTRWQTENGMHIYEWRQETASDSVPEGIRMVAEYLRATHFP
jgi:phage gp46-like protein